MTPARVYAEPNSSAETISAMTDECAGAPMQLPEITIANQSLLKTGFRNASQADVFSAVSSMAGGES